MSSDIHSASLTGLFGLRSAKDLFAKAQHDIEEFSKGPNDFHLFNLLCTLNHLREWIYAERHQPHKQKDRPFNLDKREDWSYWSPEQFSQRLRNDTDYKVIRELCNNAKHFNDKTGIGARSSVFLGFYAGVNGAGDSLSQRNYHVYGEDLRAIIYRVYRKYKEYFECK